MNYTNFYRDCISKIKVNIILGYPHKNEEVSKISNENQ